MSSAPVPHTAFRFDVETSFPRDFDFHSDAFVAAVSAILPPKQDPGPIPEDAEEVYFEDVDPETFGKRVLPDST